MKRLLLILSLSLSLVLAAFAATEVSNTVSSGGSLDLGKETDSPYRIHDIKGQPAAGVITGPDGTIVEIGGIYDLIETGEVIITERIPEGTVPLTITRQGSDIKISWDIATFGGIFRLYVLTGDGTGQFINEYDAARWVDTEAPVPEYEEHVAEGYVLHKNQIGAGFKEVYYKAVKSGYNLEKIDPTTGLSNFASAWAVGKVDVDLVSGYNFVSLPLSAMSGADITQYFAEQINITNVEVYNFDEEAGNLIKARFKDGAWKFTPNVPFELQMGKSYWIKLPAAKRVSLLGEVFRLDFNKTMLGGKYLVLGNAFPVNLSFGTVLPAVGNNEIYLYHNDSENLEKLKISGGNWVNAAPGEPVYGLRPGAGYWFRNRGDQFVWTLSRP